MAEFKPITTQEELDAVSREKYEGWVSPEEHQTTLDALNTLRQELDAQKTANAQLTAANKRYETAALKSRIADELGIDRCFAERLGGETEEEIRADAVAFASALSRRKGAAPLGSPEPELADNKTKSGLKTMLAGLKGE